jgi:saccharopine dehydrogenase-like NADP-dependent oxidoreductase
MHTAMVIGGAGFFGARIAAEIAKTGASRVLLAGRDLERLRVTAKKLGLRKRSAVQLDAGGPRLAETFGARKVDTVIHTAGPFQGQDYNVATAAILAGANYVDLADGRAFVSGIGSLDAAARAARVTVVSGASSVPGLSSAVVDQYLPAFARLDAIRAGISSGARAPGLATVQGLFGYGGKPIRRLEGGRWVETHGWLDLQRHRFPEPVGERWLGSVDVPDLELFPARYPGVKTVTFHAGFASDAGHFAIWASAGLVKAGLLPSMRMLAAPMSRASRWLERAISDRGGMFVELEGLGHDGRPLTRRWHLVVARNHGPYVPCGAAIALANKLAVGEPLPRGAMPCMGLLNVVEYLAPLKSLAITVSADPA